MRGDDYYKSKGEEFYKLKVENERLRTKLERLRKSGSKHFNDNGIYICETCGRVYSRGRVNWCGCEREEEVIVDEI